MTRPFSADAIFANSPEMGLINPVHVLVHPPAIRPNRTPYEMSPAKLDAATPHKRKVAIDVATNVIDPKSQGEYLSERKPIPTRDRTEQPGSCISTIHLI